MLLQFMQLISVRKEALLSFCIKDLCPTKDKHISQRTHTQFSVLNVLRRWFPWLRVQEMQLIIILVSEKQVCNKNSFMRSSFVFIHSLIFFFIFEPKSASTQKKQFYLHKRLCRKYKDIFKCQRLLPRKQYTKYKIHNYYFFLQTTMREIQRYFQK